MEKVERLRDEKKLKEYTSQLAMQDIDLQLALIEDKIRSHPHSSPAPAHVHQVISYNEPVPSSHNPPLPKTEASSVANTEVDWDAKVSLDDSVSESEVPQHKSSLIQDKKKHYMTKNKQRSLVSKSKPAQSFASRDVGKGARNTTPSCTVVSGPRKRQASTRYGNDYICAENDVD